MPHTDPIKAWASLRDGNHRFVEGQMRHPSQNTERREKLVADPMADELDSRLCAVQAAWRWATSRSRHRV